MRTTLWIILIVILTGGLIWSLCLKDRNGVNVCWIDQKKCFDEFSMKKELEKKLDNSRHMRQQILDSLALDLDKLINSKAIKPNEELEKLISIRKEEFFTRRDQFAKDNQTQAAEFDTRIFSQLRQYAKEFALDQGYDFVLSDDQLLSLLYGSESTDKTTEFVEFINQKYLGKGEK